MPKLVYHQILKNSLKWVKKKLIPKVITNLQSSKNTDLFQVFTCKQSENEFIQTWGDVRMLSKPNEFTLNLSHSNSSLKSAACTEHEYPGSHKLQQVWYRCTYVRFYTSTVKRHTTETPASQALSQCLMI